MRSLLLLAALLAALPARAVDIEYVAVRDPGNAPDTAGHCVNDPPDCGSVAHDFAISKYEVTNAQYVAFLNEVANQGDPFGLYNPSAPGIVFPIVPTGFERLYEAVPGFEGKPVTHVSFYDALRFANWLHNGQGPGDTETGAYTITAGGIANNTIARNEAEAVIFLPSENEWFKAAYFDGTSYFEYPTGTNAATGCVAPASDTGNSANCSGAVGALADVGAYGLSPSPYGSFDQGGNVWEWNEEIVNGSNRGLRGGSWQSSPSNLAAATPDFSDPADEINIIGFRVARTVPEAAEVLLILTGGLVLAAARRQRRA